MNTNESQELLNPVHGCLAHLRTTSGRRRFKPVDPDADPFDVRDPFIKDECKIVPSKTFRLLGCKTQVVTSAKNALMRTRGTHTMEVVGISVRIASILGLNENLARAAALGHDCGHVPFGHQGEGYISKVMGRKDFCHEVLGVIIAQKVERRGRGLNLTHETLNACMCHSGNFADRGETPEAMVVNVSDKIAFLFADYNDVTIRMPSFPICLELKKLMDEFGHNQRARTMKAISGLVLESAEVGKVSFRYSDLAIKFKRIRTLMYDIYGRIASQDVEKYMEPTLKFLTQIKVGDPYLLLALMTDKDVIEISNTPMPDMSHLEQTTIGEIIPHLEAIGKIDLCDPDLNW